MSASERLGGRREVVSRLARMSLRREEQWMVTSDGGVTHQVLVRSGGGIEAIARSNEYVKTVVTVLSVVSSFQFWILMMPCLNKERLKH